MRRERSPKPTDPDATIPVAEPLEEPPRTSSLIIASGAEQREKTRCKILDNRGKLLHEGSGNLIEVLENAARENIPLPNANLSGVLINADIDLTGADLTGADFSRSCWDRNINFKKANLENTIWRGAVIGENVNFTSADLTGARLDADRLTSAQKKQIGQRALNSLQPETLSPTTEPPTPPAESKPKTPLGRKREKMFTTREKALAAGALLALLALEGYRTFSNEPEATRTEILTPKIQPEPEPQLQTNMPIEPAVLEHQSEIKPAEPKPEPIQPVATGPSWSAEATKTLKNVGQKIIDWFNNFKLPKIPEPNIQSNTPAEPASQPEPKPAPIPKPEPVKPTTVAKEPVTTQQSKDVHAPIPTAVENQAAGTDPDPEEKNTATELNPEEQSILDAFNQASEDQTEISIPPTPPRGKRRRPRGR